MKYRIVEVEPERWVVQRKRRFWFGWSTFGDPQYRSCMPFWQPGAAREFLAKLKAKDAHRPTVVHSE